MRLPQEFIACASERLEDFDSNECVLSTSDDLYGGTDLSWAYGLC